MKNWTRYTLALLIVGGSGLALCSTVAQANQHGATSSALLQQIKAEQTVNVGKRLPESVTALDAEGNSVTLSKLMHGPVVLLKTTDSCSSCRELIDFIRENGATYAKTHHVQLVVLNAASPNDPEGANFPKNLPASVLVLHMPSPMRSGFLGGRFTPTVFFFDKNLLLTARRIIPGETPKMTLSPPQSMGKS